MSNNLAKTVDNRPNGNSLKASADTCTNAVNSYVPAEKAHVRMPALALSQARLPSLLEFPGRLFDGLLATQPPSLPNHRHCLRIYDKQALCPTPLPGPVTQHKPFAAEKPVFGLNEYAQLAGLNLEVAAKLDTGAKTASLSARDITRFKRDGETWVRFYLAIDDAHEHPIEKPLARISKIKRRAGDIDPDESKILYCTPGD